MLVKKAPVMGTKIAGRSVLSGGMSFWRLAVLEGVGGFGVDIFFFLFLGIVLWFRLSNGWSGRVGEDRRGEGVLAWGGSDLGRHGMRLTAVGSCGSCGGCRVARLMGELAGVRVDLGTGRLFNIHNFIMPELICVWGW